MDFVKPRPVTFMYIKHSRYLTSFSSNSNMVIPLLIEALSTFFFFTASLGAFLLNSISPLKHLFGARVPHGETLETLSRSVCSALIKNAFTNLISRAQNADVNYLCIYFLNSINGMITEILRCL